ncbi:MAG TPA: hypothetical protein VKR31_16485 [Rhizomicrobium sp.]|nr:hypothetical protein [Rhizomicrobium sp.]
MKRLALLAAGVLLLASPAQAHNSSCTIRYTSKNVTWGQLERSIRAAVKAGFVRARDPVTICVIQKRGDVITLPMPAIGDSTDPAVDLRRQ